MRYAADEDTCKNIRHRQTQSRRDLVEGGFYEAQIADDHNDHAERDNDGLHGKYRSSFCARSGSFLASILMDRCLRRP